MAPPRTILLRDSLKGLLPRLLPGKPEPEPHTPK